MSKMTLTERFRYENEQKIKKFTKAATNERQNTRGFKSRV